MNCTVCDTVMSQKADWVFTCKACGFWQSTLEPGAGRGVDGLDTLRKTNFRILCDQLETLEPLSGQRVLEVGCAEGWFLDEARTRGADCLGIEPSDVSKISSAKGHVVKVGFFPEVLEPQATYDLIIFNDVFEHLPDPVGAIKQCEQHLASNGLLVLNLPNSTGVFYRLSTWLQSFGAGALFERLWQKGFPSPHLTYFNRHNLRRLVEGRSALKQLNYFTLPAMHPEGLKERIQASHQGIRGALIYGLIRLGMPVINRLPSDIIVLVFQKK